MRLRGREITVALAALAVAFVCVRLGVWQLDRLAERRARNAEIRAARERPPIEVPPAPLPAESVAHRPIVVRGTYDYERERLWRGRPHDGVPGVHLITPLRLADGSAILVDRGWVPSPDAARIDRAAYRGPDTAEVHGLGIVLPRGRGDADPTALADSFPYPLRPFGIQLLPGPSSDRSRPPVALPAPALGNGPHLAYAIQWFSFAVIVVVGTVALLRRPERAGPPPVT